MPQTTALLAVLALLGPALAAASGLATPEESLSQKDERSLADSDLEFYKRLYDFGLGKRAYSYVSEYKRLPVYNFGLGKRSKLYSFGLGKRPAEYDDYVAEDDEEEVPMGEDSLEDSEEMEEMHKRNRLYSFGLGKRTRPYSFGLGKRPTGGRQALYSFGLGKRGGPSMYSFGLGKRADGRLYSFGLGKRPMTAADGRQTGHRFSFGLGKRQEQDVETEDYATQEDKRNPGHRFSFGLGKREVPADELAAEKEHAVAATTVQPGGETERVGARAKRSQIYDFGLGKRSVATGVGFEGRQIYDFGIGR